MPRPHIPTRPYLPAGAGGQAGCTPAGQTVGRADFIVQLPGI